MELGIHTRSFTFVCASKMRNTIVKLAGKGSTWQSLHPKVALNVLLYGVSPALSTDTAVHRADTTAVDHFPLMGTVPADSL